HTATKDGKSIRAFHRFIEDWSGMMDFPFSAHEEQLLELAFRIKEDTFVPEWGNLIDDEKKLSRLLAYWHRAIPLLSGVKHTRYTYAHSRRHLKGKPGKQYMLPYEVETSVPKLVFLWKERKYSFCIKLRVKIQNKLHPLSEEGQAACFITVKDKPRQFLLLASADDCRLVW